MEDLRVIIGIGLAFVIIVGTVGYFVRKFAGKRRVITKGGRRESSHAGDDHDHPREGGEGRR